DQVPLHKLNNAMFIGELSLDSSVRHVRGILSIAISAYEAVFDCIYVPEEDAELAAFIPEIDVILFHQRPVRLGMSGKLP
ncbi:MAG TPA: magnesium chelatase domain-containing protein, partial [Xanthomonadales bacterium]|nr:magnesium chelatase domain-containing protein [Xanthomonadales bacterium]